MSSAKSTLQVLEEAHCAFRSSDFEKSVQLLSTLQDVDDEVIISELLTYS